MWSKSDELMIDDFSPDVTEMMDSAIETAIRLKSRRLSYPEILLSILSADMESKRYEVLDEDHRKRIADLKNIIGRNYMPGMKEKTCLETLPFLIFSDNTPTRNYYNKNAWAPFLLNLFDDIHKIAGGGMEVLPSRFVSGLQEFHFGYFFLLLFRHMDKLPEEDHRYMSEIFNIGGIIEAAEKYLSAGDSMPESVFTEQGVLAGNLFNKNAYKIIQNALKLTGSMGYANVKPLHLFLALLDDRDGFGNRVIIRCLPVDESIKSLQRKLDNILGKGPNVKATSLTECKKHMSENVQEILQHALVKSFQEGFGVISTKQLILSLIELGGEIFRKTLEESFRLDLKKISETARNLDEDEKEPIDLPIDLCPCSELTCSVLDNNARKVLGREKEINEITKIFYRKQNRNIILYGDRGVGKTAMASALAAAVANSEIDFLRDYPVVYFDLNDVQEDELRTKAFRIFSHMDENDKRIYILDGFYRLYRLCGDLCRNRLRKNLYYFIGIISMAEYAEMNRGTESYREYFEFLQINQPSSEALEEMVRACGDELCAEYDVSLEKGLIPKLIRMADDFLISERFPAKAINLLQLSCSDASYERYNPDFSGSRVIVTRQHVARQVSKLTGLPVDNILGTGDDEDYYEILSRAVAGQDRAVSKVAKRMKMIKAGLVDTSLPPAVFLFIGLSGTGKTELATELAKVYSNSKKLVTYPMENFTEKHNVSGLIGTSAGYVGFDEGGKLINDLNNDPYSVFLFDEVEKAHPNIWDPMLELFDKGCISDLRGNTAYGNKAFFILTSNIGYEKINTMLRQGKPIEEIEKAIMEELYSAVHPESGKKCFRPEFIGRIIRLGGIVVFNTLSYDATRKITEKVVGKLCRQWNVNREGALIIEPEVIDLIAKLAFEENERGLKKTVDYSNLLADPGKKEGVQYKGGRIVFSLVDEYIKDKLTDRIKELQSAYEVRVVLNGNATEVISYSKGDANPETEEIRKEKLITEVKASAAELTALPDKLKDIPVKKLEKIQRCLDEILNMTKENL